MLALIPLFPLLGFLTNASLGRRLPKTVSGAVASAVMVASFAVSVMTVLDLAGSPPDARAIEQVVYTWIASGDFVLDVTLRVDPLAAVMILIVSGIGALIHIYSTAYMQEEPDGEYARYFSYLNLFAAFMLVLVLGANFLVLFVGWEGVGLCSYLLIGFWFKKKSAADAGKKAFVVNRIGDYAFILGVLFLFVQFGTLDFQRLAGMAAALPPEEGVFGALSLATLLLFVGATGKSAQIPLYVWLPDAMEGPTPVSALIHAATMVTAGVYMIGRNAVLFSHAPETMTIVAVVGALTALMAATIGLVQNDIKRVLAYSTVSQLGLMFLAMGVGAFGAGIFHLYTHAFFKALLFLGSGAVIHALHGEQDIRNMGGLKRDLPVTYWTFLVGALAIAGVPLLSGFFSKDEILYETFREGHTVLWLVAAVTSLLTATYMFRLVFLTFHGEGPNPAPSHPAPSHPAPSHLAPSHLAPSHLAPSDAPSHPRTVAPSHLHDAPPAMALVLVVLAVGSAVAGYIGMPHGLGGDNQLAAWLAPSFEPPAGARPAEAEAGPEGALELTLMGVSSAIAVGGILLASYFWLRRRELGAALARRYAGVYALLLNKYYVDEVYDAAVVHPIQRGSERGLWRGFDVSVVDGAVNGVGAIVAEGSAILRRLQTGSVRAYASSVLIGVVVILGYYLWR
ncbi:MAG: NADH-quinone oxidoreductase subunit L [Acidobacteria bacterium RIFCSPLOWO2_12_FULL_68_19]|nr:MAG: NADH-quinone oxidoreductase subunit L [Acidobacteria bacterium RIFCSPLOWO2_12_FULL_68_19]